MLSATELNLILVLIAIPGYYAGVFLIDRIGRRKLQMGTQATRCPGRASVAL